MIWFRAFVVWLVFIVAESVHGTLRTLLLAPVTGDFRARQLSVLTGSALVVFIAWWFARWVQARRTPTLLALGLGWLVLTLVFEFGLGRWVLGYSWRRMASEYNPFEGGLMGLGLLVLVFAPLLGARLRRLPRVERPPNLDS